MSTREGQMELIRRYFAGETTAEETCQLEQMLLGDPLLRQNFLAYARLDAALAAASRTAPAVGRTVPPSLTTKWWFLALPLIIGALMVWLWQGVTLRTGAPAPSRPGSAPVALLTAAHEAVWADPNIEIALRAGDLPQEALRLDSGIAEFRSVDGATVVLRGPSMVRFPERRRVIVESGRIYCRCPSPASRLEVETPATRVVDLGTEFAVEARSGGRTVVAVLSGAVEVGRSTPRRLHKGETVEVRSDGILAIAPLSKEDFADLLVASPAAGEAVRRGENRLQDPGFERAFDDSTWSGTEKSFSRALGQGRHGAAVRVFARGAFPWPMCRQTVAGTLSGKLVVASVWGAVSDSEPLLPRQTGILKIAFKNAEGRDIAFALQRFLGPKSEPGRWESTQVAAFAPPGTAAVQIQLMLQSAMLGSGAILFDDASLIIADAPPDK